MPEPNLPPLRIAAEQIERIKNDLPEMPNDSRDQLKTYDFPIATTETLVVSIDDFDDHCVRSIITKVINRHFAATPRATKSIQAFRAI